MALQKCPVCDGMGHADKFAKMENPKGTCPKCKGAGVIDEVTGEPPLSTTVHESNSSKLKLND